MRFAPLARLRERGWGRGAVVPIGGGNGTPLALSRPAATLSRKRARENRKHLNENRPDTAGALGRLFHWHQQGY
ncbi:MAG: hypothetical protein LBE62_05130 [Azonexus sp.]|nr:hypothetical protein [Azonexus sp.]